MTWLDRISMLCKSSGMCEAGTVVLPSHQALALLIVQLSKLMLT